MAISEFLKTATKRKKRESSRVLEKDIEGPFVKHAKRQGCLAIKLVLVRLMGFPDRTILCPGGVVFFIEFKSLGKKQIPNQIKWQNILEGLGFEYYVCDQIGQAETILENVLWS